MSNFKENSKYKTIGEVATWVTPSQLDSTHSAPSISGQLVRIRLLQPDSTRGLPSTTAQHTQVAIYQQAAHADRHLNQIAHAVCHRNRE